MRKILNRAQFNISEAVEKEIVHMVAQKENKKSRTVRYRTVRYMRYKLHFQSFTHLFSSVDPASAAFVVVVAAALAPAAATAAIVGIASVVVAAAVCMCVCVCVCVCV